MNETMQKKNVAEVLVDALVEAGVERIYAVAGHSLNGITDTLRQREQEPQKVDWQWGGHTQKRRLERLPLSKTWASAASRSFIAAVLGILIVPNKYRMTKSA